MRNLYIVILFIIMTQISCTAKNDSFNNGVKRIPSAHRYVEYTPYTLKDYKELTNTAVVMGPLGANIGTEEWNEKKAKMKRMENYSKKYDIDSAIMYALIRSESYFDPDVVSSAGAVGLTQLMEVTAGDIARKLRIQDYSLTDAEINIEFGTFYLSELIRRCNNSCLLALFSYNAGITRVRRWLSSSMIEFGKKQNMSGDLFLETIPYEETRNYGRKLVPATIMYEWLYSENHNFAPSVNSFIK